MVITQVTDNPTVANGSSLHHDAKQQLHQYLRTYVQPLLQAGSPLDLKDILHHVTIKKSKQVQHMVQPLLDQ